MITSENSEFYELNTNIMVGSFFKAGKLFYSYFTLQGSSKPFIEVRHFITLSVKVL